MAEARRSYSFAKNRRLSGRAAFGAVYQAKVREARGPLMLYGRPNELGHPRLGLSVSRKVGTAVQRNRIKRLLREAFRHCQHELPGRDDGGYDWIVVVRPHEPKTVADYEKLLMTLANRVHEKWQGGHRPPPQPSPVTNDP